MSRGGSQLQALGAQGNVQWLLDGRLQGTSEDAAALTLDAAAAGRRTITALAANGAFSALRINVARWDFVPAGTGLIDHVACVARPSTAGGGWLR